MYDFVTLRVSIASYITSIAKDGFLIKDECVIKKGQVAGNKGM